MTRMPGVLSPLPESILRGRRHGLDRLDRVDPVIGSPNEAMVPATHASYIDNLMTPGHNTVERGFARALRTIP